MGHRPTSTVLIKQVCHSKIRGPLHLPPALSIGSDFAKVERKAERTVIIWNGVGRHYIQPKGAVKNADF